jgi:hypothetical protein
MVQVGPRAATSTATETQPAPAVEAPEAVVAPVHEPTKAGRRRYTLEIPIDPEYLPFLALMLAALVLRFWDLGDKAFHHDESLHAFYSWRL